MTNHALNLAPDASTLPPKERVRYEVVCRFWNGELSVRDACELLAVDRSTFWRIRKRAESGPSGLQHGLRGKPANHAYPESFRDSVIALYKSAPETSVRRFWSSHREHFSKPVSYPTVWRWLRQANLNVENSPPDQPENAGDLVWIATSKHWSKSSVALSLAIDIATGAVLATRCHAIDDKESTLELLHELLVQYGLPIAITADPHGIQLSDQTGPRNISWPSGLPGSGKQLSSVLDKLGIEFEIANASPRHQTIRQNIAAHIEGLVDTLKQRGHEDLVAIAEAMVASEFKSTSERNETSFVPTSSEQLQRYFKKPAPAATESYAVGV